ncbi:MAG: c-type cytochrome biogenesis protein CcmI [Thiomonas sp.]
MSGFIVLAGLLTLLVLGLFARQLLRRATPAGGVDRSRLNAQLLQEEFDAIDRERAAGRLAPDEHEQSRKELARRLLADVDNAGGMAMTASRPRATLIVLTVLLPLSAVALYMLLGHPSALDPAATRSALASAETPQRTTGAGDIQRMVDGLKEKLAATPDNPSGWAMLGRSYKAMGRFDDAVAAYRRIGSPLSSNPTWLAEYADALAMQNNGNPVGEPERLAQQALTLDPDNLLALMVAAFAATARGDHAAALPLLEAAQRHVSPDSKDADFLRELIAKERSALSTPRRPVSEAPQTGR